ncbi:MAG: universal stress protein [Candidatus Melainabacteria bacterium]|nr:universal stress protein [Candidatus Melainabacteria bacterium]
MKILIALDDSPYSKDVLEDVARRAWPDNAQFKLLTVIEPFCMSGDDEEDADLIEASGVVHRKRWQIADKLCEQAMKKLTAALPHATVDFEIKEGSARSQIINTAVEWSADRIIMGVHGQAVCPHNLLGSVSQGVAMHAPCSVEIVRSKVRHKVPSKV